MLSSRHKEILQSWLPTDNKTFLFTVVILTDLIIGVIRFFQTGDTSIVMALLVYVATYVGTVGIGAGVKELPSIISKFKEK